MTRQPKALVCYLFILYGSHAIQTSSSTHMPSTNYVTKSGNVTLNKDGAGFYVNVDFAKEINDASDSDAHDPYIGQMLLALYTKNTFLAQSYCLEFSEYPCYNWGCDPSPWAGKPHSVFLDVEVYDGLYSQQHIYLDYNNWVLSETLPIANACSGPSDGYYGNGRYGILGISAGNFIGSSDIFSISLAPDESTGTLLFKSNTDITSASSYIGGLNATSEWHVAPSMVSWGIKHTSNSTNASAIFDLNTEYIGLPPAIFTGIIQDIETTANIPCSNKSCTPACSYNGRIGDLPTVILTVQNAQIALPPTLYVQGEFDSDDHVSDITLGFSLLDGQNGCDRINSDYEDYIVFGTNFMSYYYLEFSHKNEVISLYGPSKSSLPSSPGSIIWPYIVGGVVILIVLIVLIAFFLYVRNKRKRVRDQATTGNFSSGGINTSAQVPLVTDAQAHLPDDQTSNTNGYTNTQSGFYGDIYIPPSQGQSNENEPH